MAKRPHQDEQIPSKDDLPFAVTGNILSQEPVPVLSEPAIKPGLSPPGPLLTRIRHSIGLDRAIAFTVLARSWSSLAGIGTLTLIARFLTPAEQGYYYTLYSLVALQIVFELGFSVVILQTASHEAAHLAFAPDGQISGPVTAHARLASVLQKSIRWYSVAAVLMAVIVLPLGMRFFATQSNSYAKGQLSAQPVFWILPWILVVTATMCTFQLDPIFSFLEGCGFVTQVAQVRLSQAILGTSLGWIALVLHHGLLAPGLMILGQAIAGAGFVLKKKRLLLPLLRHDPAEHRIQWGSEVWPFQWRIAISWICGYFIFQLFNPILFHYQGPVEAGRMGMSISVCGTLSAISIAWMNTKASPFGQMIARREYERLDRMFFRALWQSTSAATLSCSLVFAAVIMLRQAHISLALRLLPPLPLAMLMVATILNIVIFAEALYLRAHKQEKFMMNSIAGAICIAPSSFFFGQRFGALGISACYLLTTMLVGVGHGTYTFIKWRRILHLA